MKTQNQQHLLNPIKIGDLTLKNRMVVAPLTRCRSDPKDCIPNDLMAEYYSQRADFGLIMTECSQIESSATPFPGSGGIHSEDQVQGWKKVVDRVHEKGGVIFLQIWHCGRACSTELHGVQPIGPSPVQQEGKHYVNGQDYGVPREMTQVDIQNVLKMFRIGAENAKKAGFDGIQLHGANGYLVDQFLRDGTNQRNDIYGGSIENRCRFMLEVLKELIDVFGSQRVAIRLSPTGRYDDMYDSNPLELMKYVLKELEKLNLAFVEIKRHGAYDIPQVEEGQTKDDKGRTLPQYQIPDFFKSLRALYKGVLMGNDGFEVESAEQAIKQNEVDFVSFGRLSIGNPDMVDRVKNGWEINQNIDMASFFMGGAKGYVDYPSYQEQQRQKLQQQEQEQQ